MARCFFAVSQLSIIVPIVPRTRLSRTTNLRRESKAMPMSQQLLQK